MSYIALVDCNNFFVSCERVFNPQLNDRPVVVLSNNDGCIIARSNEAKQLGIPMGAPFYQWESFMDRKGVIIMSANFPLYCDISHRVMEILFSFCPDLEIYSIDEAFLKLEGINDPVAYCCEMRATILQWVGIPVSIGIASTKTLAKLINVVAKRNPDKRGVAMLTEDAREKTLKNFSIGNVWGIGRRLGASLTRKGIYTAFQLISQKDEWIQKEMTVTGLRLVWELRGKMCHELQEEERSRQTIMTSRSFSNPLCEKDKLLGALAHFAAKSCEKLRQEGSLANWVQVFIMTSRHQEKNYYSNYAQFTLVEPTDYTPVVLDYVQKGLEHIYRANLPYKRGGVILGCVPKSAYQLDLFADHSLRSKKRMSIIQLMDKVNIEFGYSALNFAAEQRVEMRKERSSLCFTTNWDHLLKIHI